MACQEGLLCDAVSYLAYGGATCALWGKNCGAVGQKRRITWGLWREARISFEITIGDHVGSEIAGAGKSELATPMGEGFSSQPTDHERCVNRYR